MNKRPAEATNQSKSTKSRPYFVLTRNAPEVVAILATGESYGEVARLYECDPAAVMRFANKHRAVITGLAAEIERQVSDYAIAQKVNRIAALDADWQALGQVIEARAADPRYAKEPGWVTGLMVHQFKSVELIHV